MCNTEDGYSEMSLNTVNKIMNEWEYCNLLSRDREYGGRVELTCISHLFSNHLFRVYFENGTNTADSGAGSIVCHLLFSGNFDAKHFDALQSNSHILKTI